ncbi:MAG: hypothetical protein HFE49_09995 [Clostridia bacterium]|nr:hypothetical protein [Clostridia bacterium]
MTGREDKKSNDLFFVCSLIELIARKTKNYRCDIVNTLGEECLRKIYNLADVYHCEDINNVADELICKAGIKNGNFDNISNARFNIPTHWDIGKVYKRLILGIAEEKSMDIISSLIEAYSSFVSGKIDDYNSSFYYDSPENILLAFNEGTTESRM